MPTDFIHDLWSPAGTTNMRRQLNYETNLMKVIRNKLQKIHTHIHSCHVSSLIITLINNTIKNQQNPKSTRQNLVLSYLPFYHITITLKVVPN